MLTLFDVKYNTIDNTYLKHKKWSLKKAVAETSQTKMLALYHVSSIYHSLFNICNINVIYNINNR